MQGPGGVGGLLAVKEEQGSATYYPTYDGNGNISEYLNSSSSVEAHYEYDAFGNTVVSGGSMKDDFLHRFSTKPLDEETGLYYYGYRYYDPVTGRWPSRDPLGDEAFLRMYSEKTFVEMDVLVVESSVPSPSFSYFIRVAALKSETSTKSALRAGYSRKAGT